MARSITCYNSLYIIIACSVCLLLMRCSNKDSNPTDHPIGKVDKVFLQEARFLKDWNASKLEALTLIEKRYCSTKANQKANACVCLDGMKQRVSLKNDTSYNYLGSRYGLFSGYNKAITDDKQLKSRKIYILEIEQSGEIATRTLLVFVLSDLESTYYEFRNYEDLVGGRRVRKSAPITDKTSFLLDSLWNSVEKPFQNKPADYCGSTFICLTKVDEKITTRVPAYTHENWFKLLGKINTIIK